MLGSKSPLATPDPQVLSRGTRARHRAIDSYRVPDARCGLRSVRDALEPDIRPPYRAVGVEEVAPVFLGVLGLQRLETVLNLAADAPREVDIGLIAVLHAVEAIEATVAVVVATLGPVVDVGTVKELHAEHVKPALARVRPVASRIDSEIDD